MKWKQRKNRESNSVDLQYMWISYSLFDFFAFVIGHDTGINCIHWMCLCRMRFPMTSHEPSRGVVC